MIVDTSAVIAILKEEQDGARFLRAVTVSTEPKRISAANYLEAGIVVDANRNPLLSRRLDDLIAQTEITVEPVTPAASRNRPRRLSRFRQRQRPSGRVEFRRLFRLRTRQVDAGAVAVQGRRFFAHRRRDRVRPNESIGPYAALALALPLASASTCSACSAATLA